MVDHEDVTLGFWYVKDPNAKRNQPDAYIVVEVAKPYGAVEVCIAGTDKIHYVNEFEFIAPVPPPPKGN